MDEAPKTDGPGDERIVRAGEIALGLAHKSGLDPALRDDPAFAREIERWDEDLAALADELAPVSPPPRVWAALMKAIDVTGTPSGSSAGWLQSLGVWRAIAAASVAVALILAVVLVQTSSLRRPTAPSPPQSMLVAALAPKEGPPLFTAAYDRSRGTIIVVPGAFEPELGRDAELWIVPKDADEPIPVGRIDASKPTAILVSVADARRIDEETGLAVTSELSGAPVAASNAGPLIAHGRFGSF
jgi:anti-sigma-K factor RskA